MWNEQWLSTAVPPEMQNTWQNWRRRGPREGTSRTEEPTKAAFALWKTKPSSFESPFQYVTPSRLRRLSHDPHNPHFPRLRSFYRWVSVCSWVIGIGTRRKSETGYLSIVLSSHHQGRKVASSSPPDRTTAFRSGGQNRAVWGPLVLTPTPPMF